MNTNDDFILQQLNTFLATERASLYAYVRSIVRDTETAEDIVQDTMLRAHLGISTLRESDRLVPWLYRIATNACRDYLRKKQRGCEKFSDNRNSIILEELRDENAPQLDKVMECAEMGECVRQYFQRLPDSYRTVIILHDMEGMTNPEIAEMLCIPLSTAKIRLHRARKYLRDMLVEVCHFYKDERGVLICEPKHK